jgi:tRNA(fMet)-specific endonuclease VapC
MIAFDSDVLSDILRGVPRYVQRAAAIAAIEKAIPVVVVEEVQRGWLNAIRKAESGKGKMTLEGAYAAFASSFIRMAAYPLLPYTAAAETLFQQWKRAKIRIGAQDMRIAAICHDHGVTLVTRNARDYVNVPGLTIDVWN